jgi:signal transduction histidine kinase
MSAEDLLELLNQLLFTSLAVLALIDYIRYRDTLRRDVALLFGLLGIPFIALLIANITGTELATWLAILIVAALIAEPYALMRIVRYLRVTPPRIMKFALYGMIAVVAALVFFGENLPPLAILAIQAYFAAVNLYAMVGFVRGTLNSSGMARQRLRYATIGSGLLGGTIVTALLSSTFPFMTLIAQVLTMLSAIAFFIGFTPPRWLRRVWQLSETTEYLTQISTKPINERLNTDQVMNDLCEVANRAVGGMASGIVRKAETDAQWILAYANGLDGISLDKADVFNRTWAYTSPSCLQISDSMHSSDRKLFDTVGATALLIAPIVTTDGVWGLLVVFLSHGSLFVDDDLGILTMLARQNAILLENSALVEQLLQLNTELELKASQLTAANKEMEAFSYSVSHDLRSPLRALDGFSQVLEEDYADHLDEEGKRYLARIRAASQRMGQLIDDLLELSRLTRSEMRRKQVNLSEMAYKIVAELREQNPDREVECHIEDDLIVNGDVALLRVVMNNLLGNAWKYTGKQPNAQVTFGCTERGGQRIYFVKDNGAGFDMEYADKLFGVFQRLHSATEFPGNGVGLATVQRIIHRHGGEIWAEAEVGRGATFYFSL